MTSKRSLSLNLSEIDTILTAFYKDKSSQTKISKTMKIGLSKIKKVIDDYGVCYLRKYPELKPIDVISVDQYESHINSHSYKPSKLRHQKKEVVESSSMMD